MTTVVLLSSGRHAVSRQIVLPRVEAQAIRMVTGAEDVIGLHAGPSADPASDALGYGLRQMLHLVTAADDDPLPYLIHELDLLRPRLVLAGRRSQGGDETGMVPYVLARALSMVVISDAVAIEQSDGRDAIVVHQLLAGGVRRRLKIRPPAIVTIHPGAPPPAAFAYGQKRRGIVDAIPTPAQAPVSMSSLDCDEKAYRPRPKMIRQHTDPNASAADRLKAVTGTTDSATSNVLVRPDPDEAAREIVMFLRRIGVGPRRTKTEGAAGSASERR